MATPAQRNLTLYQGDRYTHRIEFREADGVTPKPMPGVWAAQIRSGPSRSSKLVGTFTIDATAAVPDGVLTLTLSAADTLALPPRCFWDLENVTDEVTHLAGQLTVTREITVP